MADKGFEVSSMLANNIVRVRVWGLWDETDAKAYWEKFQSVAQRYVGKKWYVLADITDFPPQKPEVHAYVERTMAYARKNGLVRAANLVDSALSRMQVARLSSETELPSYTFFRTEEDAIRWLVTGK